MNSQIGKFIDSTKKYYEPNCIFFNFAVYIYIDFNSYFSILCSLKRHFNVFMTLFYESNAKLAVNSFDADNWVT